VSLWLTIDDADAYFAARPGAAEHWVTGVDKTGYLTLAQQDIAGADYFTFTDDQISTPTDAMKQAVCEQALFLLRDPDMETRLSLQAQGVTSAGIVQESFGRGATVPIAPRATSLLAAHRAEGNTFGWSR